MADETEPAISEPLARDGVEKSIVKTEASDSNAHHENHVEPEPQLADGAHSQGSMLRENADRDSAQREQPW